MKKQRILFTIFHICDYGGIVADLELKCRGLRAAGHEVKLVVLRATGPTSGIKRSLKPEGPQGTYPSEFGRHKGKQILANTESGWYWIPAINYATDEGMAYWRKVASRFDVIFHEIPGPVPDKDGWWRQLFDLPSPVRQIMIAHDAHFREMYPHIIDIASHLQGIACTTPAGYMGLSWMPTYRAFIGAPHPVLDWDQMPQWKDRKPVGVAAHMWKAWKHQDMIVKAAPYLQSSKVIMAGDGIERNYMTSETKTPPEYKGIWKKALKSGNMAYKGLIVPDRLFKIYQQSRVMIDMSWSDKFNGLGNHFNRSIIEGYNNGVVPICVRMNMKDTNTQRQLFKGGLTHVEVEHTITPKELAEVIDETANMHRDDAMAIIDRGRKMLLRFFAYNRSSTDFLKLAHQEPCGVYPELEMGRLNKGIKQARDLKLAGKPTATIKASIRTYNLELAAKKLVKGKEK